MSDEIRAQIIRDAEKTLEQWIPSVTFADTYWGYRLLLQRQPEFGDEHSYKSRCSQDLKGLVKGILQSQEFSQLWGVGLQTQPLPPVTVLAECGNLRYWFNLRDRIIGQSIAQGCYELEVTDVVRRKVAPGMNCLDLGANLGYFTVLLGSIVGPEGCVHAFEPFPSNYELLSRNVRENHLEAIAQLHRVAAHDKNEDCVLHFRADDLNDNFGSMFVAEDKHDTSYLASLTCNGGRVDEMVPGGLPIHFVKMDIEGGEVRALRGMTRILERDHPVIVVELNEQGLMNSGHKPEELIAILKSFGYNSWDIGAQAELVLSADRGAYVFTNLLCT
jgi:FkbM family methyltransferase